MKRFWYGLIAVGLLIGCATTPYQKQPLQTPPEQEVFLSALDQFVVTKQTSPLQEFQQNNPESFWSGYAETILRNARELAEVKTALARAQQNNERLTAELQALQEESAQLEEKIEQLKTLLIELEQRSQ